MTHAGRIAILTYHSLDDSGSVISVSPRVFAEHMRILHELNVKVISLSEVYNLQGTTTPGEHCVILTFDDGFQNVYEHGLPILQRYGFPATVFLVTDYCGKLNSWPSQPAAITHQPLLRWKEIKEMNAAGLSFGSHTRTHPDLRTVTPEVAENEIVTSKKAIEDVLGRPVDTFAYPYGAYNDTILQLVQTHFPLACSTRLGFVGPAIHHAALERLDMYYLRRPALFHRLFSWELNAYLHCRRTIRDLRKRMF
jgi:peptidoglycan/xylan/chitin deacetylase (PgdA/CDA1 family)